MSNTDYITASYDEYTYLRQFNVYYTDSRFDEETNTTIYTYKKTSKLFSLLAAYYEQLQRSDEYNTLKKLFDRPGATVLKYDNIDDAMNAVACICEKGAAALE